jgi:hypothetical protein
MDNDDEVRDRATYFRAILDKQEAALNSMYILNGMQVSHKFSDDKIFSAIINTSVVDPDPQGSETFCRIRIRNSR